MQLLHRARLLTGHKQRNTHTGRAEVCLAIQVIGLTQRRHNFLRDLLGVGSSLIGLRAEVFQHHHKLIAPQARHQVLHTHFSNQSLGDLLQHLDSGKLRVLAVTSAKRSRFVPNVPTFAELGMPEVTGVDWYGLFLPAKTPPELVAKLHATTSSAVKEASFADSLAQLGFEPYQLPQAEFAARIKEESAKWGPIVAASGFSAES